MKKIAISKLFLPILFLFYSIQSYSQVKDTSLIVGNFIVTKVVDGDTFKFKNLGKSTRLLCIDTEETFKSKDAKERTEEIASDWLNFYKGKKGESKYPAKLDSPFGYDTWQWAKKFMEDVDSVRLEKDDNIRVIDVYDRYLVYVIVYKKGIEINYNLECVKTGHSPYFNKYGNSRRFHKEFVEAQEYAKQNKLGIWNSKTKCYPDYPDRLKWWNKRAEQIGNFESKYQSKENYFNLLNDDDYKRLNDNVNSEVVIFGSIGEIFKNKYPYLVRFSHSRTQGVDLVVFEDKADIFNQINFDEYKEYYTYLKGKLEKKYGKYRIVFKNKEQVWME
jgi:endonuclease YncB( thermonuclease family)